MDRFGRSRIGWWLAALLPIATILVVVWPNLSGTRGLGSETSFDVQDPLFGDSSSLGHRYTDDSSPLTFDWPRDRRLVERVQRGHFDLWNPVPGNGAPLAPDPAGIFSPLRLVLYAAPVAPYTAFVLFRVVRLFVAALGAFLLARAYSLSGPASVVVSIAFGLSGGMLSQLPFATVGSVCWLPWICWVQLRCVRRPTLASLVPFALVVAAMLTGGHQPIVGAMALGGLCHGLGLVTLQPRWRARGRAALLMAAGYGLGGLLAAPAILPFAELLRNAYSYKTSTISKAFQLGSVQMNRFTLFPGAVMPQTLDALRDGVAASSYPYLLNFSCGVLAYLLAAVAVIWRRWRREWMLMTAMGVALCFAPVGLQWFTAAPFVRDIQGRYAWSLLVLPVSIAAGFGVDALQHAGGYRRGQLFEPANRLRGRPASWPRDALTTTVIGALAIFALLAVSAALLMWAQDSTIGSGVFALFGGSRGQRLRAIGPLVGAGAALALAAYASGRRLGWGPWLAALLVCAEVATIAVPHLGDPPSRQVRNPPFRETGFLAARIEEQHTRVGGQSEVVVGWRGWREFRSQTPIAPLRYARFLTAGNGEAAFTSFNIDKNRSALLDLAAVGYLIAPRTAAINLEGDPQVVRVSDIKGVSFFQNRGAVRRARVVHRTIPAASADRAVAELTALTSGAAHVETTALADAVILEPGPRGESPIALAGGPPSPATFIVDEADHVAIDVAPPEAGYLVLADTHYPGWTATVDGQHRPILPANVGFRAVYVEKGKHTVTFKFQPASVRIGLGCTVAGLLVCGAILTRDRVRRRFPPRLNASRVSRDVVAT